MGAVKAMKHKHDRKNKSKSPFTPQFYAPCSKTTENSSSHVSKQPYTFKFSPSKRYDFHCPCSTYSEKRLLGKYQELPRRRMCFKCNTFIGYLDKHEPVQCHNCHHSFIPKPMFEQPRCKCKRPSKCCKNICCVQHFMKKNEYIKNHHIPGNNNLSSYKSNHTSKQSNSCSKSVTSKHFYKAQKSVTDHVSHLPQSIRKKVLSSMVASIGSSKRSKFPFKVSSTLMDHSKCLTSFGILEPAYV